MNAIISECGHYRYLLTRNISVGGRFNKKALFIMLNPSTADAFQDDPTISRCIGFAERELCSELSVVNLYALRSTDPKNLKKHQDPVGPKNKQYVLDAIKSHDLVIAAWGANPMVNCELAKELKAIDNIYCLGKTKSGEPKHPLYIRADTPLILLGTHV